MATVMNEKIQKISEEYVNGMVEIITRAINEKIDAAGPQDVLDEGEVRAIATDAAEDRVRDMINDGDITVSLEA